MVNDYAIWGTPVELTDELDDLQGSHPHWFERYFLEWATSVYRDMDYARRTREPGAVKPSIDASYYDEFQERPLTSDLKDPSTSKAFRSPTSSSAITLM